MCGPLSPAGAAANLRRRSCSIARMYSQAVVYLRLEEERTCAATRLPRWKTSIVRAVMHSEKKRNAIAFLIEAITHYSRQKNLLSFHS